MLEWERRYLTRSLCPLPGLNHSIIRYCSCYKAIIFFFFELTCDVLFIIWTIKVHDGDTMQIPVSNKGSITNIVGAIKQNKFELVLSTENLIELMVTFLQIGVDALPLWGS